ncbi:MAG: hypothetical protein IKU23_03020 [Clostridia bacterium]|nr:hypothetical protein [Clostridia bacterium]
MKKLFICCVLFCFLCGCSSTPSSLEEFQKTEAYDVGYEKGYEDGILHVLSILRENANDWDRYMKIEDVESSIRIYYDESSADVDEARDAIIYHPDFEHYTLKEMLEELIIENID